MPYDFYVWTDGTYYYADDWRGNLVYGGFGGAGNIPGLTADAVFQAVVNTGSCKIVCSKGIFNFALTSGQNYCVSLPYGNTYVFMGCTMPTPLIYPFTHPVATTPTDGTQFRGASAMLATGAAITAMFQRAAGSSNPAYNGGLEFYNLGFFLPFGSVTGSTNMYPVYDIYSGSFRADNILMMPYGYAEAGYPKVTYHNVANSFYIYGHGGASNVWVGTLLEVGIYECAQLLDFDNIEVQRHIQINCVNGLLLTGVVQNLVHMLATYNPQNYVLKFQTPAAVEVDNRCMSLFCECINWAPSQAYLVAFSSASVLATVDRTIVFNGGSGYPATITSISQNDTQLAPAGVNYYMIGGATTWSAK
jgi:hypothetical protein